LKVIARKSRSENPEDISHHRERHKE